MTSRRFVPVDPQPDYAYARSQYRAGSLAITVYRFLFGQCRVSVTWDHPVVVDDPYVLEPEF